MQLAHFTHQIFGPLPESQNDSYRTRFHQALSLGRGALLERSWMGFGDQNVGVPDFGSRLITDLALDTAGEALRALGLSR